MADFNTVLDPILDEMRAEFIAGGTGGSGGVTPVGGDGITIAGGTFTLVTADADDVLNGTANTEAVDVKALRGALTAGQAVDVTSQPDGVTGDYRDTFSVTGSLGFASFPKFASGLSYLMIADLTATTSGTVTPSGTWLDGTTAAKSLTAGTMTRVAMLFNAANKAKFTFASTGSVSVTNCREYEVTACSNEAIAYIAQLANPDAFSSYYLVKADMVQPWTAIIDMGSSSAVTIASGLSYKLNAATGTHTLTVDTCPAGYDGRDAIIRITLGGSGVIQAVSPLQLGGALVPYAINNCVVRFRDGEAVLLVEDTLAGYVVTVNSGTGEGSLPYGLAASDVPYIAFSPATDGTPVELSGATAAEEVTVVGNGHTSTTLTGAVDCGTSKFTVANLALSDVQIVGGTMTLGDAYIPSGSTVAVSGGGLAVKNVSGNGGVIDLGGTRVLVPDHTQVTGCTLTNGYSNQGGAFYCANQLTLTSANVTGNTAAQGGGIFNDKGTVVLSSSIVSGNTAPTAKDFFVFGGTMTALDGNTLGIVTIGSNGVAEIAGRNAFELIGKRSDVSYGTVTLTSGAILDLTGNTNATPIAPGGGITFAPGGATVQLGSTAGTVESSYMMDNVTLPAGAKLTNTAVVDLGGTYVLMASGQAVIDGCVISGGYNSSANGGAFLLNGTPVFELNGATVTSNYTPGRGAFALNQTATLYMSDSVMSGNSGIHGLEDLLVNGGCTCTLQGGCTLGFAGIGGSLVIRGSNAITNVTSAYTDGTVTISSGASINLTSSINPGGTGGITVLTGGCTVNGNAIAAGTYTSIDSNGQPT